MRGGVHKYAAQARPKVDAARAEKHPFRTETTNGAERLGIRRCGGTSVPVGLAEELQRLAGELKLV